MAKISLNRKQHFSSYWPARDLVSLPLNASVDVIAPGRAWEREEKCKNPYSE
jgi:hypothetical protein